MNITITYDDQESFAKKQAMISRLYSRPRNIYLFSTLGLGIGFLVYGFITGNASGEGNYYYWSPITAGFVFLYVSYFVYRYYNHTSKALKRMQISFAERAKRSGDSQRIISITSDRIAEKNFEEYHEYKWSVFSHYKIHKGFVFLYLDEALISPVMLELAKMTETENNELILFLREKLYESHDKAFFL